MKDIEYRCVDAARGGLMFLRAVPGVGLGERVRVLERRDVVGGAAVTEEFHPGFRNSSCSYTVSLLHPDVIRELRLAQHGLRVVERPMANFLPLPDGDAFRFGGEWTGPEVARFSRRDAERLIEAGRVAVDGKKLASPAFNVTAASRITVDGKSVSSPEPLRLWLYHKPAGLVTTAKDEKGRQTVFDALPDGAVPEVSDGEVVGEVAGARAVVRVRSADTTEHVMQGTPGKDPDVALPHRRLQGLLLDEVATETVARHVVEAPGGDARTAGRGARRHPGRHPRWRHVGGHDRGPARHPR